MAVSFEMFDIIRSVPLAPSSIDEGMELIKREPCKGNPLSDKCLIFESTENESSRVYKIGAGRDVCRRCRLPAELTCRAFGDRFVQILDYTEAMGR